MLNSGVREQYHGSAFKVALLDQWVVVVSGADMVEELRKMPDEVVSILEAADEVCTARNAIYICLRDVMMCTQPLA